jgi:hypothetical protein
MRPFWDKPNAFNGLGLGKPYMLAGVLRRTLTQGAVGINDFSLCCDCSDVRVSLLHYTEQEFRCEAKWKMLGNREVFSCFLELKRLSKPVRLQLYSV